MADIVSLRESWGVQGAAIFEVEVEHAWSGVIGDGCHEERAADAELLEDFCDNFGVLCAVFGPSPHVEHVCGEEDSAVHGDLVEFDGLWGEESTCLKQFYV